MVIRNCSIPACEKPHYGKGFCRNHYDRWKNWGDPLGGTTPRGEALKFFHDVVLKFQGNACFDWPYPLNPYGYGQLYYKNKTIGVHRAVCLEVYGDPPEDKPFATHRCGRPICCNPKHLRWGSTSLNQIDRVRHGTSNRGKRHGNSKLSEEQVLQIRELRMQGMSTPKLGKMFGVSSSHIKNICDGKWWSWLN